MNNNLLSKLAFTGLKNNKKAVLPYILVSAITVMVFHILQSLINSKFLVNNGKTAFYGADYIVLFMGIGSIAVGIFSVIFILYGNQFVMKGRKKEIGLYGVLGLSKKDVSFVLFIENLIMSASAIVGGILAGTFLNKLMVLLLYRIIRQPMVKGMDFSLRATILTAVFFSIIYAVCFIYNVLTVRLGNPITILKSENIGEKEPKVKYPLLIIGVLAIACGYFLAVIADNTMVALNSLFIAIIFVTLGTYALFIAGTIFVLKMLKKNKNYYYKTKHFISISNLMFRMKHNAAGLASICILSTAVILLLVCSTSLMMLGEQNIDSMFPKDVMVRGVVNENCSLSDADNAVDEVLKTVGITDLDRSSVSFYMGVCDVADDGLSVHPNDSFDFTKLRSIYIVTAEQYELYTGKQASLAPGEIYRYSSADDVKDGDKIKIFGNEYSVKKSIDESGLEEFFDSSMSLFGKEVMVVADNNEKAAMLADCNSEELGEDLFYIGFNAKDDISNEQLQTLRDTLSGKIGTVKFSYKEEERSSFYSLYGGTFFVGIFLAALFLIATVMIIFYKQMSEGVEDKKRFEILSNAGLSDKEARGVIKSQVMLMFFLPVCTAIIHIIFASNILRLFMAAILIVDTFTFNMAVAIVSLVFLGVYALVYRITSKQYYNIVYGEKISNESVKENRESFVGNNSYNQCGAGNRA